ncbi:MAG: pyrroline-5-carboxylate reductase [Chromatiales bacterium]|nr:pyrroline-5-carboxylate reductase [Gammaproteobacteria bacterium]MBW6475672.1 pyrroline-5-carboxylate reductase [Chromatiales bacterium]
MQKCKIGFIGGGNMAGSLIGGLISDGFAAEKIWVAEPNQQRREELAGRFSLHTSTDNLALVNEVDVVVLAVKPQAMQAVCQEISTAVQTKRPLLISVAAGLRSADLNRWLGGNQAIVRSMPNTPALVQSGATALFANAQVSDSQAELAESIMRAVGLTLWLDDETLMDAVTAISGSGPAYFFLLMEMLEQTGSQMGLAPKNARLLALQTAFGAAKMALESQDDAATLRARVTSPGGTTERAIGLLEQGEIRTLFAQALDGARQRAAELADQLGAE